MTLEGSYDDVLKWCCCYCWERLLCINITC